VAGAVPCGRLDGYGLALDHGGGGAQWTACCWCIDGRFTAVYGSGDTGERVDAVVGCGLTLPLPLRGILDVKYLFSIICRGLVSVKYS
jgi:hypothetical protein